MPTIEKAISAFASCALTMLCATCLKVLVVTVQGLRMSRFMIRNKHELVQHDLLGIQSMGVQLTFQAHRA